MYDSYSKPRWLWLSLGHYSNHLTAAASLTGAAAVLIFTATGVGVVSHLLLGLVVAVYAVWAVSATAERTHHRSLCPRELDEAPVLDPQPAVDRKRRELRVWHSRRRRRFVPLVVGMLFFALYVLVPTGKTWIFAVGFVCSALISAYLVYVDITHQRLHPWCPYCRHGGRGPRGFRIPDPTDPSVPKPVPQTT